MFFQVPTTGLESKVSNIIYRQLIYIYIYIYIVSLSLLYKKKIAKFCTSAHGSRKVTWARPLSLVNIKTFHTIWLSHPQQIPFKICHISPTGFKIRWDQPPNSPNIPSKTKYYPHSLQGKFSTTSSPRIAFPMEIKLPYIKSSKPLPPVLKK